MPHATANVRPADRGEPPDQVLAAYHAHQARTGRGNSSFTTAARTFLRRWPDPQDWTGEPLGVQLAAITAARHTDEEVDTPTLQTA